MNSKKEKDIEFLLSCLIDGPREERKKVLHILLDILPFGEHPSSSVELVRDPSVRAWLRQNSLELLNEIKFFYDWKNYLTLEPNQLDLEKGVFLISRISENVAVSLSSFQKSLDRLASLFQKKMAFCSLSQGKEILEAFAHFLFVEHGFAGDTKYRKDPSNSFLTELLISKKGNPISLSVLCLLLAQRLELPMTGIALPDYFLIRYKQDDFDIYMDPYQKGELLVEDDILDLLRKNNSNLSDIHLLQASTLTILKLIYQSLIAYFSSSGREKETEMLNSHFALMDVCSLR